MISREEGIGETLDYYESLLSESKQKESGLELKSFIGFDDGESMEIVSS